MNIIYVRMQGYDWVSVPTDEVVRELEKLGHKIYIVDHPDRIPTGTWDWVWSPYESVTLLGDVVARTMGIPHYSHIEVLPPWRCIDNPDYENYGLTDKNDPEIKNFNQMQSYYIKVGTAWKNADIRSLSTPVRLEMHKKLFPDLGDVVYDFPPIELNMANKAKKMFSPKRIFNRVVTISRAIAIKRYDLLVKVMNQLKTPVTWTIVGDGPMLKFIETNINNNNVTVTPLGGLWGWAKWYELLKSSVLVYAMGGMPPIEAALMGCKPICIEQQPTRDIPDFDKFMESNFGNSVPIFKYDKTEDMAELVDSALAGRDILKEYNTVEKFMSGETNVRPAAEYAKTIVERMISF